jgi:hypothetical protein
MEQQIEIRAQQASVRTRTTIRNVLSSALFAAVPLAVLGSARLSFGGLVITPTYAANINADANATTIKNTIQSAINEYQSRFSDPVAVNITFQEGGGLGSSSTAILQVSYSSLRAAMVADATSSEDATALAHLLVQAASPVDGNNSMWVSTANARALGLAAAVAVDGTITLNTSIMNLSRPMTDLTKFDLKSVAMHEIDEVLGMGSGLNLPAAFPRLSRPQDLFRYDGAGARSYVASATDASATSFFSIDGTTHLARFSQDSGGDYGDWFSTGAHAPQVQDAFALQGNAPDLGVEVTGLDVQGYTLVPEPAGVVTALLGVVGVAACSRRRGLPA